MEIMKVWIGNCEGFQTREKHYGELLTTWEVPQRVLKTRRGKSEAVCLIRRKLVRKVGTFASGQKNIIVVSLTQMQVPTY